MYMHTSLSMLYIYIYTHVCMYIIYTYTHVHMFAYIATKRDRQQVRSVVKV